MNSMTGLGELQRALTALGTGETKTASAEGAAGASKGTGRTEGTGVSVTATGGDSARVSASGGALLRSMAGPDVRGERVAALREAIAGGAYTVPADAVAGKLMESMMGGS